MLLDGVKRLTRRNRFVYQCARDLKAAFCGKGSEGPIASIESILRDEADARKLSTTMPVPKVAMAGVTNICNLNCLMCQTNASKRPKGFMKKDVFESMVRQLKANGIHSLGISIQGETFLHEKIFDLIRIAESRGLAVWLGTNGQFPERLEAVCRRFPHMINYVRISADGARKETYESIRRGASFEKLMESFRVLHAINRGKIGRTIDVNITAVLSMQNIPEVKEFFDVYGPYCRAENITFITIDSMAIDQSYFWSVFPFRNLLTRQMPCNRPFKYFNVTHSGDVTMCCEDYSDELVVGNLMQEDLAAIWHGPRATAVRAKHLATGRMDIDICSKCFKVHRFAYDALNRYIHDLYRFHPELSAKDFSDTVMAFLKGMDDSIAAGGIAGCKRYIAGMLVPSGPRKG